MMKHLFKITIFSLSLCGCSWLQWGDSAKGQIIYHWERPRTGIEKFSRDFRTWFFSEEAKLDLRANWHADRGIWASYIAYPGAQPVLVRSMRENDGSNPRKYRVCMENRGYTHRKVNIPTVTNIYIYKPQRMMQDIPFGYEAF